MTLIEGRVRSPAKSVTGAQEGPAHAADFDTARAHLSDAPMFEPFRVSETESLARALDDGRVEAETPVLVLERGDRHLALLTLQMAYHHVAQGKLAGEPWMVTF